MDNKTIDRILAVVSVLLVIGIILNLFKQLNKSTQTNVISDEGLKALQDPDKKKQINQAIEDAKKNQLETGVWKDPVVDLS